MNAPSSFCDPHLSSSGNGKNLIVGSAMWVYPSFHLLPLFQDLYILLTAFGVPPQFCPNERSYCGGVAVSDNGIAIGIAAVNNNFNPIQPSYEVYFSTDQGRQWEISPAQPGRLTYSAVAISSDGNIWLAAGDQGIFKSTDFGLQWKKVSSQSGLVSISCNFDCSTLYAADGVSLYKSTDGGLSLNVLQSLSNAAAVFTSRDTTCVVAVNSTIYTIQFFSFLFRTHANVFLSTDSGVTFTTISGFELHSGNLGYDKAPAPWPSKVISISGTANCRRLFVTGRNGDLWESYPLVF